MTGRPPGRYPLLALSCAACAACSRQAVVDAQHRQLPPLPKVDPLRDGIYVRSVALPVGEGADDEGRPRTREQLVAYDFRPAVPPYTTESLDELPLFPKEKEVALEDVDSNVDEETDAADGADGLAVKEEQGEHAGAEEVPDQAPDDGDGGGVRNETVAEGDGAAAAEASEESGAATGEGVDAADGAPSPSEEREEADAVSSSSGESKEEEVGVETSTGPIDGESDPTDEGRPIPKDDGSVESGEGAKEIGLNGEAVNGQDADSLGDGVDLGGIDPREERGDENRDAQSEQPAVGGGRTDESDSFAEDGETRQETVVAAENDGSVETPAESGEDGQSGDESKSTPLEESEKREEAAGLDEQVLGSPERSSDENSATDAVDTAEDAVESKEKEQEDEIATATETEAPPETTASEFDTERVSGVKPEAEDDSTVQPADDNVPKDSAAETTADGVAEQPEEAVPTQDEDIDRPKERITVQYDDDGTISSASTNSNKDANRQFVDGLDELDKLFESVEVPDELDVGADGSSMQDVLVGQGLKIVWKRARNFGKGVKARFEGMAGSVRKALPQLDGILSSVGGDNAADEEEVTLDSLLDLDKLKEGESLLLDKEKEKKEDSEAVQLKKEEKNDEPSQIDKEKKDKEDAKKKKDAKSDKKKSFSLVKSKKAQRLWKFARRKYEQVRHIIDDILGIFEGSDDDEDDNFGLGDLKLKDIKLPDRGAAGEALKGGVPKDFDAKFGSEVDESFLKSRIEAMMKERQGQEEKSEPAG